MAHEQYGKVHADLRSWAHGEARHIALSSLG